MNGVGRRVERVFQDERRIAVQRPEGKVNGAGAERAGEACWR